LASVSHSSEAENGFIGALRRLRDPLLLVVAPITFAVLSIVFGYLNSWPIGFDFRGTLWEPARALLDGAPIYPQPTRDNIVLGNPAVYPPVFILLSVPLALLPVAAASWLWFCVLGGCVFGALWILGVRDWRCYVIALTSPVVVHGLFYGNLTIVMVLLVALAWRYRARAGIAGLALGTAVAAKLFVWPLVVWLLLTRRYRAAAWAVGSAVVLVLGAWALIGFEGLRDYPKLLRVVQDVYAERSISVSTVAGALGASVNVAVAVAGIGGLALLGAAALVARRADGDRRAFALAVGACVIASPIVWPNYAALLFVPIAITWPRLAPVWCFGYVTWLLGAIAPKPTVSDVCCRPADVPEQAWAWSHTEPVLWFALGTTAVVLAVVGLLAGVAPRRRRASRSIDAVAGAET
jgi:glycosyl transferase family 87